MKAFLDTNIYNHLTGEQMNFLLKAKNEGIIEIFCIPQILGEIASSFHVDEEKGRQIVDAFAKLISERVINQPPILLANDLQYFLTKERRSIYLDRESKVQFLSYIEKLKKGNIDEETNKFILHSKNKKKRICNLLRLRIRNLSHYGKVIKNNSKLLMISYSGQLKEV